MQVTISTVNQRAQRALGISLVMGAILLFQSAVLGQCVQSPPGMVSWWPGDGDAVDITGSNPGTLLGSVTFPGAMVQEGFEFDGDDDGVTIPHSPDLDVQATGFTAGFWMKGGKNQPQPLFLVVDKSHGWLDSTGWLFQGDSNTGNITFGIGDGGGGSASFVRLISTVDVLDNVFHHVAGTWDGSSIQLYIDGQPNGIVSLPMPANNTRPVNLGFSWASMGGGVGGPSRFFRGIIDELVVFSPALSAQEIHNIYLAGSAGICGTWTDLRNGLAGALGIPVLVGDGSLAGGSSGTITVSNVIPSVNGALIVGFSELSLPFKCGVLVPNPDRVITLGTGLGIVVVPFAMPPVVPSGFMFFLQYWLPDAAGPCGFAASNGLKGTTP